MTTAIQVAPVTLGLIEGEDITAYHASESTSHTKLEVLRDPDRGPARYHAKYIAKTMEREGEKEHLTTGSGIDALLLEGRAAFDARFIVAPDDAPRYPTPQQKNAAKPSPATVQAVTWWNAFEAAAAGKTVLDSFQMRQIEAMRAAALRNPDFAALLSVGRPQITFRVPFKHFTAQVRPDWWNPAGVVLPCSGMPTGPYMLDLKSAEDMDRFLRNREDFGYDRQAALYREVVRMVLADIAGVHVSEIEPPDWYFGVVFKTVPIDAAVFKVPHDDLSEATDEVIEDLALLRTCYERGEWPGAPRGISDLPRARRWNKKPREIFG